jgi:hypothetical protein
MPQIVAVFAPVQGRWQHYDGIFDGKGSFP